MIACLQFASFSLAAETDRMTLAGIEPRMESWKSRGGDPKLQDIGVDLAMAQAIFYWKKDAAIREQSGRILRRAVVIALQMIDSRDLQAQDLGGEILFTLSRELTEADIRALEIRMSELKTSHAQYQMSISLFELAGYQLGFREHTKPLYMPVAPYDQSSVTIVKTLLGALSNAVEEHMIKGTPSKDLNRNLEITVEDLRECFVNNYVKESGFFKSTLTKRYAALVAVLVGHDYRRAVNVLVATGSKIATAKDFLKTIEEAKVIAQHEDCQNLLVPGSLDASLVKLSPAK